MTKHQSLALRYALDAAGQWRNYLLAAFVAIFSISASASEPFTIQIGAFETPSEAYTLPARAVGEIYATQRSNGVIALSVGRFANASQATAALAQIKQHYPSAYVRRAHPQAQLRSSVGRAVASANNARLTPAPQAQPQVAQQTLETDLLSTLTENERKHVVYLDGKLHYKQGEAFVPLTEYRAQQARP